MTINFKESANFIWGIADLRVFGQEFNPESYAICNSGMLIKGQNTEHVKFGNSFTQDGLKDDNFDYMLSNPPFGVEWKKIEEIRKDILALEKETEGLLMEALR